MKSALFVVMALSLIVSLPAIAKENGHKGGGAPAKAAPEKKATPEKKVEAPPLQDITLTGKIVKKAEKSGKEGKATENYVLVDAAGQEIKLPPAHAANAKKGEAQASSIRLEDYMDKKVTIMAKAIESDKKNGGKIINIKQIVNIALATEEAAPAAAAPAAAAPAPEATPE
ncbi:MAG: hypothetical protein H7831_05765 [Magnetococcus sp. WYHC-3]